ncbi:hypothetical protein ASPU41_14205 [Arthrobacter sp. U41]|nr:hypothetical protein ASPU41_14205 [Arthrobacter sp. U41]
MGPVSASRYETLVEVSEEAPGKVTAEAVADDDPLCGPFGKFGRHRMGRNNHPRLRSRSERW